MKICCKWWLRSMLYFRENWREETTHKTYKSRKTFHWKSVGWVFKQLVTSQVSRTMIQIQILYIITVSANTRSLMQQKRHRVNKLVNHLQREKNPGKRSNVYVLSQILKFFLTKVSVFSVMNLSSCLPVIL